MSHLFHDMDKMCANIPKNDSISSGWFGAPIVADETLIGVSSWICYDDSLPDIFVKVYPHLAWIQETMRHIFLDD